MRIVYSVTSETRSKLKKPIGKLVRGSFVETMKNLKDSVAKENPPCIITVGDTVSRNLNDNGLYPKLSIVDNLTMRKSIQPVLLNVDKSILTVNPQATITDEAIDAVREALESPNRVRILVEGEEDLLTLIAVLYAPENSYVIYGQPHEGIVIVKVTKEKKQEISVLLQAMEARSKS